MANPAPIRDSKADAARRKRERKSAHRDKDFTAWMHKFPCCVCGHTPAEQHHHPPRSHAGWNDRKSLMLCAEHHRGFSGIHLLHQARFETMHGLSIDREIERLNKLYEGEKK